MRVGHNSSSTFGGSTNFRDYESLLPRHVHISDFVLLSNPRKKHFLLVALIKAEMPLSLSKLLDFWIARSHLDELDVNEQLLPCPYDRDLNWTLLMRLCFFFKILFVGQTKKFLNGHWLSIGYGKHLWRYSDFSLVIILLLRFLAYDLDSHRCVCCLRVTNMCRAEITCFSSIHSIMSLADLEIGHSGIVSAHVGRAQLASSLNSLGWSGSILFKK